MNHYVVIYLEDSEELIFTCQADDPDHAREQCEDAYPACSVEYVYEGGDVDLAMSHYYGVG